MASTYSTSNVATSEVVAPKPPPSANSCTPSSVVPENTA